jgi:pSer/pThr/pTyr-binding forkhead associated (FHA) protein
MFLDSGKFCPACKMLNDSAAVFCVHCGVPFDRGLSRNDPTTHQVAETSFLTADDLSMLQDMERNIPENGIAIYLPNLANPFSVRSDDDFLIGRKTDESFDNVVDLSPFDAFKMGISRRHVRIQRVGNEYQITDLNSTNGSKLNGKQLPPGVPVTLPNPADLQLGRMRLYLTYQIKNG